MNFTKTLKISGKKELFESFFSCRDRNPTSGTFCCKPSTIFIVISGVSLFTVGSQRTERTRVRAKRERFKLLKRCCCCCCLFIKNDRSCRNDRYLFLCSSNAVLFFSSAALHCCRYSNLTIDTVGRCYIDLKLTVLGKRVILVENLQTHLQFLLSTPQSG